MSFFQQLSSFSQHKWSTLLGRKVKAMWDKKKIYTIKKGVSIDIRWLQEKRGILCTIDSPYYPYLLKNIIDSPIVLFIKGANIECLQQRNVAIVGTRNPDKRGKEASEILGYSLSNKGINVVSGFAFGIDIYAHRGVLRCVTENTSNTKGVPIVVLGSAIDILYPRLHISLAAKVLAYGGILVSEYPPCSVTHKHNFICRNRIISGLSTDTVVVQSPETSGALATADFALEQGRNVWVHRVGIHSEFVGTRKLFEQGAELIGDRGEGIFI